jgi:SAM-dependent methyltransferase
MVLLKTAQRKALLPEPSPCAYGIDIFSNDDQSGNSPEATYRNAAAMGLLDRTVLHTASFTETLPFADGVFGLVTANLSLHNANREGRLFAVEEVARVCAPGGRVVIVDLYGYFKDHERVLGECGWTGVEVSLLGLDMMFGIWPCEMLAATRPE